MADLHELAAAVRRGERAALARAITLVESQLERDADPADHLLQALLPASGNSHRIGITGAPGVGKSTLIERLGLLLCANGHRVAVLAVDPSSSVTGGSILGDKTRMTELARHPRAFIRPSPGGSTLGGVAAKTRETMLLCEAAGHDIVLVETIGTGQSEVAVHDMVDFFLVLLSPAAGDELQGIKRGVMELADGVVVHKADGDLTGPAHRTAQQCLLAMQILHPGDTLRPFVVEASSLTGDGVPELWQRVHDRLAADRDSGATASRRTAQASRWLDHALRDALVADFLRDPDMQGQVAAAREQVATGNRLASTAARDLLRGRRRQP